MGSNVGKRDNSRIGKVKGVYQCYNARLNRWQKYSRATGKLMTTKITAGPYKGVEKVS